MNVTKRQSHRYGQYLVLGEREGEGKTGSGVGDAASGVEITHYSTEIKSVF